MQKVQASVVERQKEKFCYPPLSIGKEDTLIILNSQNEPVKGHVVNGIFKKAKLSSRALLAPLEGKQSKNLNATL